MMNRMRRAEKQTISNIVKQAVQQARSFDQAPLGVGSGRTTQITSLVSETTTAGPDGQTQYPFMLGVDGTTTPDALVPEGYPIIDYRI